LGAGLTIKPRKKRLLLRNPIKGGQGPKWAVEPYDDDDEEEEEEEDVYSVCIRSHSSLQVFQLQFCKHLYLCVLATCPAHLTLLDWITLFISYLDITDFESPYTSRPR
jgi:hypothetical protein